MELLKVDTLEQARNKLKEHCADIMPHSVMKDLLDAAGHILAEDIISKENIPPYRRSTVDGYAVMSRDLSGAGDMIPSMLRISGEVTLGTDSSSLKLGPGSCIYVPTGGEIPDGADAVVMVEYCELFGSDMAAVSKSASPGENVVQIGEDMSEGEVILHKGRRLRPQDIGVLAAAGISSVPVIEPWRVTVISTGDELVSPDVKPGLGQIRDINSYTLAARSSEEGFDVVRVVSVRDDSKAIEKAIEAAKEESDVVIMSGGSSQGKKDMSAELIGRAADSGVLTHGIAAKPGKPTITGFDHKSNTLLIGLPGHPAAALMVYEQLLICIWREFAGCEQTGTVRARINMNVPSAPGRKTFQLVRLTGASEPEAVPIFARSGMISPMSISDGYFIMSENQEGVRPGDIVEVILWR